MGGVRPLVAMMATNSDSQHYAALALLKLADNFENHVTIAGKCKLLSIIDDVVLTGPVYLLHL